LYGRPNVRAFVAANLANVRLIDNVFIG